MSCHPTAFDESESQVDFAVNYTRVTFDGTLGGEEDEYEKNMMGSCYEVTFLTPVSDWVNGCCFFLHGILGCNPSSLL